MTDDDGRQPIAIGHQRDSGDLKIRAEGQIPLIMLCNLSLRHSNSHGMLFMPNPDCGLRSIRTVA